MDRQALNRQPLKVTSYAEFLQKMKPKKAEKPAPQTSRPVGVHSEITKLQERQRIAKKTKVNVRCTTETSAANCESSREVTNEHFVSKESVAHTFNQSLAFTSVQYENEWDVPQSHPNKENTFTQPKSYSRIKHNVSYEDPSCCDTTGPVQSDELASFMLNQILLIVREITKFNRQRITYLDFLEVLRELNMIQNSYEPSKDDSVFKLWEVLTAANKENTTCLINLSIVILAVMNTAVRPKTVKDYFNDVCYSVDGLRSPNGNVKRSHLKAKQYKKNKEGFFDLSEQDVSEINKTFKQLRVTRMFLGRIHKKSEMIQEKAGRYTSHSFKPFISQKSRSLAKKKRTKGSENAHHKSVFGSEMPSQCHTQRDQREVLEEVAEEPSTCRNSSKVGEKRSQLLYSMAKSKSREKRDRKTDEIQLQNNEHVYTFKPVIGTHNKSIERKKQNVAGENKQVNRMLKARLEKEVLEAASAKGIPYNSKQIGKIRQKMNIELNQQTLCKKISDKSQSQAVDKEVEILPIETVPKRQIFTFEVYLEEDVRLDKITIYEGDNPDTIAQEFVSKHKLKPEMLGKLAKSLFSHLSRLQEAGRLGKIQEESVEHSFQI